MLNDFLFWSFCVVYSVVLVLMMIACKRLYVKSQEQMQDDA